MAEQELVDDDEVIVFCLIDLLEAPFKFSKEIESDPDPYLARYAYIQRYMQEQIAESLRNRFYGFPVVMELETWLLADTQALNEYFRPESIKPWPNPESVLRPAEELSRLMWRIRKNKYKKTLHGPAIFKSASAVRVYEDACPHFVLMIDQLLRVQGLKADEPQPITVPDNHLYLQWADLLKQRDMFWQELEQRGDLPDNELALAFAYDDDLKKQIETIEANITNLHSH
jgi:hypothetical protein